jgi:hypothetical protein
VSRLFANRSVEDTIAVLVAEEANRNGADILTARTEYMLRRDVVVYHFVTRACTYTVEHRPEFLDEPHYVTACDVMAKLVEKMTAPI